MEALLYLDSKVFVDEMGISRSVADLLAPGVITSIIQNGITARMPRLCLIRIEFGP